MKVITRQLLEDAAAFGKKNAGYGYSTARLIREALATDDSPIYSTSGVVPGADIQDDGQAMIVEINSDDPHFFIRLQSWDEDKQHPLMRSLVGKKIMVTLEIIDD